MAKYTIIFLILIFHCTTLCGMQQEQYILNYIRNESHIKEGGCDIFKFKDNTYLICVSSVTVGNKSELNCKKIGAVKAKKEIISYINGSKISSYTEFIISENTYETLFESKVIAKQEYIERIKETVLGEINQCTPLGGWYSDDSNIYYYAIFKLLEI